VCACVSQRNEKDKNRLQIEHSVDTHTHTQNQIRSLLAKQHEGTLLKVQLKVWTECLSSFILLYSCNSGHIQLAFCYCAIVKVQNTQKHCFPKFLLFFFCLLEHNQLSIRKSPEWVFLNTFTIEDIPSSVITLKNCKSENKPIQQQIYLHLKKFYSWDWYIRTWNQIFPGLTFKTYLI
jgi:hypothetical protein